MTTQKIPISLVRSFEAAGRTGSFKAASLELGLSPSAISHSVRRLENFLGTALFERNGRGIRLNPDGEELLRHVGGAFDSIRHGFEVVSTRTPGLLRLHCAPSFAAQWLTPRLPRLVDDIPEIDVRLSADTDYASFETDEFDADIVYGQPQQTGNIVMPLGEEVVTPLCAPALAGTITKPEDLLAHSLIESDNKQIRWSHWFSANGLDAPPPNGSRFDRSFLAIAFAVDGMGVALESTTLAERELENGRLVAPLLGRSESVCYIGHHLVIPQSTRQRQIVRRFSAWMSRERGVDAA
ncbi:LysR substrate-binding domain-containing protein [Hoeflea poritis]|uniref:LysR substrate-binding domain-containing protein n=1 Tax=Hoeflea poritis TaxID=2993659 RepID=A0ABT4VK02_9HYPH|nr:LysR substrate-binding domain-containing protein [Hoeflea poritis]MDA4845044.1 LysR substrate-binding domain-containing protein [Hoeflea poritis]